MLRGFEFTHEAVREWEEERFAPPLTDQIRRRRKGKVGRRWYVDETYVKVQGRGLSQTAGDGHPHDGSPPARFVGLGRDAEHAFYEAHLADGISFWQPGDLTLPDDVHRFVSCDRVQSSVKRPKPLAG